MVKFNISINSLASAKDFVGAVTKYSYDIDLTSGRYVVDAKSIMGIFSLDLSKPICVEAHTDDASELMADVKAYIVE